MKKLAAAALFLAPLAGMCKPQAQAPHPQAHPPQAPHPLAQQVEAAVRAHGASLPGAVSVRLGPQVQDLPACGQAQVFLPAGSKPWGALQVGVRCLEGAAWTRFVPAHLGARVRHAVAARALPPGAALAAQDLRWTEADLDKLPGDALVDGAADAALPEGSVTLQPVAEGAVLRRSAFKAQPVIQAGQWVRLSLLGDGFVLATEGRAQGPAAAGQSLQLRLAGGRLVSAVARPDGTAEKPF